MIGKAPNCYNCRHFNRHDSRKFSCAAFPDGIPDEIIMGKPHLKPLPGQKNKLVFEETIIKKK